NRRSHTAPRRARSVLHGNPRMSRHVIVIGGGVIGAACAYFLSKSGCTVTMVERGEFGKGCSHGNCGFVCPSHVLPLAEPRAARRGGGAARGVTCLAAPRTASFPAVPHAALASAWVARAGASPPPLQHRRHARGGPRLPGPA